MLRKAVEPQRLSLMAANTLLPSGHAAGPGHDANRDTPPRDTARRCPRWRLRCSSLYCFSDKHRFVRAFKDHSSGKKSGNAGIGAWYSGASPRGPGAGRVRAGWAAPCSHRISIRMNFPYAAAKKTDGKTIRPTIPAQTLPRDSGSDRFWGAEMISVTVW